MDWRELEALLPNLFVVGVVVVLLASWLFRHLKNKQNASVIMKLLDSQSNIDIGQIRSLLQPPDHALVDLRRGILLLGVSLASAIFAMSMIDPEYRAALLGLSAFPTVIGLIYLVFHFALNDRNADRTG